MKLKRSFKMRLIRKEKLKENWLVWMSRSEIKERLKISERYQTSFRLSNINKVTFIRAKP